MIPGYLIKKTFETPSIDEWYSSTGKIIPLSKINTERLLSIKKVVREYFLIAEKDCYDLVSVRYKAFMAELRRREA
jgi:hypothetical protein